MIDTRNDARLQVSNILEEWLPDLAALLISLSETELASQVLALNADISRTLWPRRRRRRSRRSAADRIPL